MTRHQCSPLRQKLLPAAWVIASAVGLPLLCSTDGRAALPPPPPSPSPPPSELAGLQSYLRVSEEKGQNVALEVAVRQFRPKTGDGPVVGLVAVAHLGDEPFYARLQERLADYDVVLYESVLPPGAGGAAGEDEQQRRDSTKAAMEFTASLIERYHRKHGVYPGDFAQLAAYLEKVDPRVADWQTTAATDAWGKPLQYASVSPPAEAAPRAAERPGFSLISYGADGVVGGDGAAADQLITPADQIPPFTVAGDDNLQAQLAKALGLAFQLDAVDYRQDNWRCSDLAMDQIDRALQERGIEFGPFSTTLTGASLPAQLIKMLLRAIRWADVFLGGAIADTSKVALIEVLGDEKIMEQSLGQMGEGFTEVIVGMRNQRALSDLQAVIDKEPDVRSVAIFYGAAHMPDFQRQLMDEMGYELIPEGAPGPLGPPVRWLKAIEVDFDETAIAPEDLEQMRRMIRQALRQQFGS